MPQSEEHLAVLDLLGVSVGVVALTKVDRVDPDLVELARIEVEERLAGTALAGLPDGRSGGSPWARCGEAGRGAGGCRRQSRPLSRPSPPPALGRSGLHHWRRRDGGYRDAARRDAPDRRPADAVAGADIRRVRGLQVHETEQAVAEPGYRTAVNLAGVRREQVGRGAMLGRESHWLPSRRFVATAAAGSVPRPPRPAWRLSGPCRVRRRCRRGSGCSGADGAALVTLEKACRWRQATGSSSGRPGGGGWSEVAVVLDPAPKGNDRRRRRGAVVRGGGDRPRRRRHRHPSDCGGRSRSRCWPPTAAAGGSPDKNIAAGTALSDDEIDRLRTEALQRVVSAHHTSSPLRPGMPAAQLAGELGVASAVLDALIAADTELEMRGAEVALAGFLSTLDPPQESRWLEACRPVATCRTRCPRHPRAGDRSRASPRRGPLRAGGPDRRDARLPPRSDRADRGRLAPDWTGPSPSPRRATHWG